MNVGTRQGCGVGLVSVSFSMISLSRTRISVLVGAFRELGLQGNGGH